MVGYTMLSLWIFSQPILENPNYQEIREPSGFLTLAPQAISETCLDMRAKETIEYDFESDQPVVFNIHFHDGFNKQIPVHLDDILTQISRFTANIDQFYCLMWSNPKDSRTTLTYKIIRL